jgi:UDP:flavonoid glycosyltransferase YjiC (YdhE family)
MSKVLFLSVPSHGHVNPTLGLVSELIKQGEEITYFSSQDFKEKIESTGAVFRSYCVDLDIFTGKPDKNSKNGKAEGLFDKMPRVIQSSQKIIEDSYSRRKA